MKEFLKLLIILKNAVMAKKSNQIYKPKNYKSIFKYLRFLYEEGFILTFYFDSKMSVYYIYFNYVKGVNMFSVIKNFNRKHYPKYITYKDLCTFNNQCTGQILYVSTSKYGLIPHYKALKYKVGGKIIFLIR
jgi:ribosomal protein S8